MPEEIRLRVDGATVAVPAGSSLAAVLVAERRPGWRRTRMAGEPRGVFCGMGVCFDCLVELNGVPGVRACLVDARPGDEVVTDLGSGGG